MKLKDFVIFNPRETLSKSKKYRKISMDQIKPFTRKIESKSGHIPVIKNILIAL